jgi:hypothetical protein
VQHEEVIEWSEVSALVWPVQLRIWFMLQWQRITRLTVVFVPSAIATWDHGLSHYLTHDDILAAMDGDDISIHTIEEMEKYKSLHRREFARTRIYDVNLL